MRYVKSLTDGGGGGVAGGGTDVYAAPVVIAFAGSFIAWWRLRTASVRS